MKRVLFLFWHGIGDNILATPAIRKYKQTTGNSVGWMQDASIARAEVFRNFPDVDQVHYCKVGNPYSRYREGRQAIQDAKEKALREAEQVCECMDYDQLIVVDHTDKSKHKIHRFAAALSVNLSDAETHTHFVREPEYADRIIKTLNVPSSFAFIHDKTSAEDKDIPERWWRNKLPDPDMAVVTPHTYDLIQYPIAVSAELLVRANYRILADSALFHLAHALNVPVEVAYFGRGENIWNNVKPIHPGHAATEEVVYSLDV